MDKYSRWRGLVLGGAMGVACLCSIITVSEFGIIFYSSLAYFFLLEYYLLESH